MEVTYQGYECVVSFARYFNGNTAIQLIDKNDHTVVTVASVNGEEVIQQDDVVGIKTWSENVGIVEALVEGNILQPELQGLEPTGFVAIEYYKLTPEAMVALAKHKAEQ